MKDAKVINLNDKKPITTEEKMSHIFSSFNEPLALFFEGFSKKSLSEKNDWKARAKASLGRVEVALEYIDELDKVDPIDVLEAFRLELNKVIDRLIDQE